MAQPPQEPSKAVELDMGTDAHAAELLVQQDRFDDGLHSKAKCMDWGALINHIVLPVGVLFLMWFCWTSAWWFEPNIAEASGSCQQQWPAVATASDWQHQQPCKGATWENFIPHLWIPVCVWAVSAIAFWPLQKLYHTILLPEGGSEVEKKLTLTYQFVGTDYAPPIQSWFLNTVLVLQIILSLYETFIFAARTYATDATYATDTIEMITASFFTLAYIVNGIKSGFSFEYCISVTALVDIFTVTSIVVLLTYGAGHQMWINFKFLRIIRAQLAYEALERTGFVAEHVSELARAFIVLGLKTLTLVVTMAGFIFLCEVLGEPPFLRSKSIPTGMGELSFWQMIYWIFTTISTVGYGDFSPTTNLSQGLIIIFIVVGVIFFSTETGTIIDIMGDLSKGLGKYTGPSGHLVLVGGGVRSFSPTVQRFLDEVFTGGTNTNVVMLSSSEISEEVMAAVKSPESRGMLHYFQGSPLSREDLLRVKLNKAAMVFVLANASTNNVDEEDRANILRAMNVHKLMPEMRMRVMILRPVNKMMAFSVGLPVRMCCSLNELKGNILAQSCRIPGFSTLLLNLCITDQYANTLVASPVELAKCEPWQQQYFKGNNLEICGIVLDTTFTGMPFWQAALKVRQLTGDLLVAVQVDGNVMIFPENHLVREEDIAFVIAHSFNSAAQVAQLGSGRSMLEKPNRTWDDVVDYRPIFRSNDHDTGGVKGDTRTRDLVQFMLNEERVPHPSAERKKSNKTMSAAKRKQMLIPGLARTHKPDLRVSSFDLNKQTAATDDPVDKHHVFSGVFGANSYMERNKEETERRKEEALEAEEMVKDGGHIVLLICQPELQWQQVVAFVRPLRAQYLSSWQPILVMGPGFPPAQMWDMFHDVCFVVGNPEKRDDLENVGVVSCDKVVLLAGPPNPNLEARMADGPAMIVNSVLESIFVDNDVDRFAMFEYSHPGNSQMLPKTPLSAVHHSKLNEAASKKMLLFEDTEGSAISSPRFAAGRIFVPSLFGSLFANTYTTPGILELIEALVMPSRRGQSTYPFMLPALERVAIDWIARTYGELCEELMANGLGVQTQMPGSGEVQHSHVMPLGLYRKVFEVERQFDKNLRGSMAEGVPAIPAPLGAGHQGVRFVYCNPGPEEVLLPGDQVYVLAPAVWGALVSVRADLAEEDDHDREIFKSLAAKAPEAPEPENYGMFAHMMQAVTPGPGDGSGPSATKERFMC